MVTRERQLGKSNKKDKAQVSSFGPVAQSQKALSSFRSSIPGPIDLANFELGNSEDKRQSAAPFTSKAIAADRTTPPPEALIHRDVSQGLKGETHILNQKTKMASRSLKGTRQSSSSEWKVLKSPSLGDSSITPFELHPKVKSPFELHTKVQSPFGCTLKSITPFELHTKVKSPFGSSETRLGLQIGDKECSNLDDMEPEYNPALSGGDMKDCSSVLSNGELGRTPLKEVSNLSAIGAGNKISGPGWKLL